MTLNCNGRNVGIESVLSFLAFYHCDIFLLRHQMLRVNMQASLHFPYDKLQHFLLQMFCLIENMGFVLFLFLDIYQRKNLNNALSPMGFHWKVLDILYFPLLHDFGMHLEFLRNFHPIYLHVYNCIPSFQKICWSFRPMYLIKINVICLKTL